MPSFPAQESSTLLTGKILDQIENRRHHLGGGLHSALLFVHVIVRQRG